MNDKSQNNILVDTGFWYAIYDTGDKYHDAASRKRDLLKKYNIIFPWPCLYESLNTRFVRQTKWMADLDRILSRPEVTIVDDRPYRERALKRVFQAGIIGKRPISLVDMVIRLMLDDVNLRVRSLLTFNIKDFDDLCKTRRIQIL